jgi:hypothetical protein
LVNFILVPFAYFTGEEKVDFLDSDFDADKKRSKYAVAIKYTVHPFIKKTLHGTLIEFPPLILLYGY